MTVSTASFLSFLSFPFFPPFSLLSFLYHVDVASPGPDRDTPGQTGGEGRAGREGDRPVPCRAGLGLRKRPADRQTDGRSGRQTGAPLVRHCLNERQTGSGLASWRLRVCLAPANVSVFLRAARLRSSRQRGLVPERAGQGAF